MLPAAGYLVIAWQADNPGVWLAHCQYVVFLSIPSTFLFPLSKVFSARWKDRLTDGFLFLQHWVAYG